MLNVKDENTEFRDKIGGTNQTHSILNISYHLLRFCHVMTLVLWKWIR